MERAKVRIEARVYSTEDEEKVSRAIKNVVGEVELKAIPLGRGLLLRAQGEGLEILFFLKRKLERERIRDAARARLLRSIEDKRIVFGLNKQAASAEHVSFSIASESPLGPITVIIECDDPKGLVEWLTGKEEQRGGRGSSRDTDGGDKS
jgi:hypothetical protein